MALKIETFSNDRGGNAFFKAIGHPLAQRQMATLLGRLGEGRVALYDPLGFAPALAEIYDLSGLDIVAVFVQDLEDLDRSVLGLTPQPVTELPATAADAILVVAFDAERMIAHIRHLLPPRPEGAVEVFSLDAVRIPDDMLAQPRSYLTGLNFATNFVLFREAGGHHTRLVTANYWSRYGARDPEIWCCLFDEGGRCLAEWRDPLAKTDGTLIIDSAEVRSRFGLGEFTGQLFVHVLKPAGHDIVKYALDTYGDSDEILSCTHDANPWPADLYAGLPAPRDGEKVILWIQNSHPSPIPAGGIGLNLMGRESVSWLDREVAGFGLLALDTAELLPEARWPQQIEIQAGKHFVRPRYEVVSEGGRRRIAHANVERTDLTPNPRIPELSNLLGKGFVLPAPILPPARFRSLVLPTPMATCQRNLPTAVAAYDRAGKEVGRWRLGCLPRHHETALAVDELLEGALDGAEDWGHMELQYDFGEGGDADGWLHGLFRYEDKRSGHIAETSFGAHVFNTVLTYKGEPQSYAGRAPGLSTRLFLRFGPKPYDAICHLIYPASTPWHAESETILCLRSGDGDELARRQVAIPCGGSLLWRPREMFSAAEMEAAGETGYAIVRDLTCRLFGYHGLVNGETAFSFDHMFGF